KYMGLKANQPITDIQLDRVFIGSHQLAHRRPACRCRYRQGPQGCRDHQAGHRVPGSDLIKAQAEQEGLDKTFIEAGFEWREPGCSMCLAMNP
ncbi:aconitase family protein, partial [Pseudomonas viridiflava]|uniref:aconitase family protein n=1 Tax=Pseudomonas viridiflava TaxID=33069 RepID=UPI001F11E2CD